ncbi:MAG: hypothetical protein ABW047_05835 [Nitrospiraceae bacterium]
MTPAAFRTATSALLLAVLFVMGSAMSNAVSHELQHAAHHSAGSHSKGICAWMCATGAMAGQVSIHLAHTMVLLDGGSYCSTESPPLQSATRLNSRAPPFLIG